MTLSNPQSRLKRIDTPIMEPGNCLVCLSSRTDDRDYLDFNKQLEWYGSVYICTECVTEAATIIDFVPNMASERAKKELEEVKAKYEYEQKKFEAVKNAFLYVVSDSDVSAHVDTIVDGIISYMERMASSDAGTSESEVPKPKTTKSRTSKGSGDLLDPPDPVAGF